MFQSKKKKPKSQERFGYDPDIHKPILKCSICNGEQVAGFKDTRTGKFHEVMFIRDGKDLQEFLGEYGLSDVAKEY